MMQTIQQVLLRLLSLEAVAGYRSQILGLLYAVIVGLQGLGYLDNYWDTAEMAKGAVVGLMPLTMTAKLTKLLEAIEKKA